MSLDPRAVLLLDNCSAHPNEEDLVSNDGKVIGKFLPPNVMSLIQPMDQGVLISIKRHYRHKLLEELVLDDTDIVAFLKGINMLKIMRNISSSWNEITEITLRRSWGKIFPIESHSENTEPGTSSEIQHTVDNDDFATLFNIGGQDINETEISE